MTLKMRLLLFSLMAIATHSVLAEVNRYALRDRIETSFMTLSSIWLLNIIWPLPLALVSHHEVPRITKKRDQDRRKEYILQNRRQTTFLDVHSCLYCVHFLSHNFINIYYTGWVVNQGVCQVREKSGNSLYSLKSQGKVREFVTSHGKVREFQ